MVIKSKEGHTNDRDGDDQTCLAAGRVATHHVDMVALASEADAGIQLIQRFCRIKFKYFIIKY